MTQKIFRSTVLVAAIVLLCSLGIIMGVLYGYSNDIQVMQLKDELHIAAVGTEDGGIEFLKQLDSERFRVTWIGADGEVFFDSHADEEEMENHADRKEIRAALQYGVGSAIRQSDTLLEQRIYEAKRLNDGSVLRISTSQQTMMVLLVGMLQPLCIVILISIILSAVLANRISRKITEPLDCIDLENPLSNDTYEELSPLLNRIHQQHRQIDSQMHKYQRKSDELEQIISNMQEGLVLLDKNRCILIINPAARELFAEDDKCVGNPFYTVDRRQDMADAVAAAFQEGRSELRSRRNGREYQFLLNRIESGDKIIGLVILAVDITDTYNAEKNRREFSANVTHELKTPLQAIIGSAELLENGLVKPDDQKRFVGHIRKEASRLVNLIEDVIRLSRLDEGMELPKESVDLLSIAEEVKASLDPLAQQQNITISVSGEHCKIQAVPGLIREIAQNLCSNAVKYNVPGGSVEMIVSYEKGRATLTVKDTGIGIQKEYQSRVFERFFRVDKSHSKQSGGTGLGLSIVKHAVQYHHAQIELQSTPGEGTTITVMF